MDTRYLYSRWWFRLLMKEVIFFDNGDYTFNFDNVSMVSYGYNDFLHFQTSEELNNITIVNAMGGLNFEPGARNSGEVEIINNLTLQNVPRMVGGSGAQGDFRVVNLNWDVSNWNFSKRNVDFILVNPIKPDGWSNYSANNAGGTVSEFYTHNLSVVDAQRNPIQNARVRLVRNDLTTEAYNLLTDTMEEFLSRKF